MSAGYANRLKHYPNKGVCGLAECEDTARSRAIKIQQLAKMIQESKHFIVLTGAGISTSAGIPDFRGPAGIWTLEQENEKKKGKKRKRDPVNIDFASAKPTLTHEALTKLAEDGVLKFCITQNVDGLHRRAGLSRSKHAVLHGCAFTEKCEDCQTEFYRDEDCQGMSFQPTGRNCDFCGGVLRDTLLDWEDPLPEDDLERSEQHCKKADLALCLGTSLRIQPAASLPLMAKRMVIVNLQVTPYDQDAALVIRGRVDEVMEGVMQHLGYRNWRLQAPATIERTWKMEE